MFVAAAYVIAFGIIGAYAASLIWRRREVEREHRWLGQEPAQEGASDAVGRDKLI